MTALTTSVKMHVAQKGAGGGAVPSHVCAAEWGGKLHPADGHGWPPAPVFCVQERTVALPPGKGKVSLTIRFVSGLFGSALPITAV